MTPTTDQKLLRQTDKIIVAVDDMFFAAKILGAAQNVGRTVERVNTTAQLMAAVSQDAPALIILDLNSQQFDALQILATFKSQAALSAIPILGFLSHVQVDLKRRIEQAGCDVVMPRSAFAQNLQAILSGNWPEKTAKKP
ncbi:MAG: response regulator [Acidobacteria bacterium]|nr:response regulator [Acidobacteriota bacterium]